MVVEQDPKAPAPQLAFVAQAIWHAARGETHETKLALAWMIKNRSQSGTLELADCVRDLIGDLNVPAPSNDPSLWRVSFSDAQFRQIYALVCRVWSGQEADPTDGAVRAHHHLEAPVWTECARATGFFGPWMFYDEA